jgi:ABC-2 type transport system permease protein
VHLEAAVRVAISPFAHLAAVPDQPPDRAGVVVLTVVGVVLGMVGLVGYTPRELH